MQCLADRIRSPLTSLLGAGVNGTKVEVLQARIAHSCLWMEFSPQKFQVGRNGPTIEPVLWAKFFTKQERESFISRYDAVVGSRSFLLAGPNVISKCCSLLPKDRRMLFERSEISLQ